MICDVSFSPCCACRPAGGALPLQTSPRYFRPDEGQMKEGAVHEPT